MFRLHPLPISSIVTARAARPPFRLLLAIPETATEDLPLFSPVYIVSRLLGPWRIARKLIDVHIWAPEWNEQELASFVSEPFPQSRWPFTDVPPDRLRVRHFLQSSESGAFSHGGAAWSIVHFAGRVHRDTLGAVCLAGPFFGAGEGSYTVGMLRDKFEICGTRFFILQCPEQDLAVANQLAEWVAGEGGPPVLVVGSSDRSAVRDYFGNLFANLVHNLPLSQATQIATPLLNLSIEVDLYLGAEGDGVLRLDQWIVELTQNVARERKDALSAVHIIKKWKERQSRYLHPEQIARFANLQDRKAQKYEALVKTLDNLHFRLQAIPPQPWHHDSEGSIPIAEETEFYDSLDLQTESIQGVLQPAALIKDDRLEAEAEAQRVASVGGPEVLSVSPEVRLPLSHEYREWVILADREAARAPRVLNAAFRNANNQAIVDPNYSLRAGRAYDLLMDIGPRWNKIKSLVRGQEDFPEYALDPTENGHEIEVLFVSEDFTPHVVTAHLWLPQNAGRSHQIVHGKRAKNPGPLALHLHAPRLTNSRGERITAKGRLCLYYRNNLLQAATVRATVAAESVRLDRENAVEVDFVLTSTYQDLEGTFARRRLNLMLNDDGEGGHRIVATAGPDSPGPSAESLPAGWVPYNPSGATILLDDARQALLNCFFLRDKNGVLTKDGAFDEGRKPPKNLGKEKVQFKYDLRDLCQVGARLFDSVTNSVNVEGDQLKATEWSKALRKKLESYSVVQVARTVRAEYAFPWALVYDIPMPGPNFQFCPVTDEWNESGVRENAPMYKECPHAKKKFHLENIFCPYGFWGLKHIVEQPPSVLTRKNDKWVLRDTVLEIPAQKEARLAVGITRDPQLNPKRIDEHLAALKKIPSLQFSAQSPADNLDTARSALEKPEVVYLLCHGKVNPSNKQFYLGIGDPDDKNHQIYPVTVHGWVDTMQSPNLSAWSDHHPLVFINGCHTAELKPERTLQFVSEFSYAQASGVLGTEVSIQLPVATDVAQQLLEAVAGGKKIGEALHEVRWRLANKGNLLGLAYTLYAMADLHVFRTQN